MKKIMVMTLVVSMIIGLVPMNSMAFINGNGIGEYCWTFEDVDDSSLNQAWTGYTGTQIVPGTSNALVVRNPGGSMITTDPATGGTHGKVLKYIARQYTSEYMDMTYAYGKGRRNALSFDLYIPAATTRFSLQWQHLTYYTMLYFNGVETTSFGDVLKNSDGSNYLLPKDKWVTITVVADDTKAGQGLLASLFIDGVCFVNDKRIGDNIASENYNCKLVYKSDINHAVGTTFYIDEIEARNHAATFNAAPTVSIDSDHQGQKVKTYQKDITLSFAGATDRLMDTRTYSEIKVYADGTKLQNGTDYTLNCEDMKNVKISFADSLLGEKTYTVSVPDTVKNLGGKSVLAADFTFKTVARPATANEIKTAYNNKTKQTYVMFSDEDIENIKELIEKDEYVKAVFNSMKSNADTYISQGPKGFILDSVGDLNTEAAGRIATMSFVYLITGLDKYALGAWTEMNSVCEYSHWGHNKNFLDAGELAKGMSLGYNWCKKYLDNNQEKKIINAIQGKAISFAEQSYNDTATYYSGGWDNGVDNVTIICNIEMMMASGVLYETNPAYYASIIEKALISIERAMPMYAPDGGFKEGTSYWDFATSNLIEGIEVLESVFGTDFGLYEHEGVKDTGYFTPYMEGNNITFQFGDGYNITKISPTNFYFSVKNNDAGMCEYILKQIKQKNISVNSLFLKMYSKYKAGEGELFELDRYFVGALSGSLREKWDNTSSFLGYHGGNNKDGHGDLDIGTFVFDRGGKRWAEELVSDDYNYPHYFGPDRFKYYKKRGEGQNVLLVNPKDKYYDQVLEAQSELIASGSGEYNAFAVLDTSEAYGSEVSKAKRGYMLTDMRKKAVIRDELTLTNGNNDIWWFMHTKAVIEIEDGGKTAILTIGRHKLVMKLDCTDDNAKFSVMDPVHMNPAMKPADMYYTNLVGYCRKLAVNATANAGDFYLNVSMSVFDTSFEKVKKDIKFIAPIDEWEVFSSQRQNSSEMNLDSAHTGENVNITEKNLVIDLGNKSAANIESYNLSVYENDKLLRKDIEYKIDFSNPYKIKIKFQRNLAYNTEYKIITNNILVLDDTLIGGRIFTFKTEVAENPDNNMFLRLRSDKDEYKKGENIKIWALAYDESNEIKSVKYFLNDEMVKTETEAHFDAIFDSLESGTYKVGAIMEDEAGNKVLSNNVRFSVTDEQYEGSIVMIPSDGARIKYTGSYNLRILGKDISEVSFYLDGVKIYTSDKTPFEKSVTLERGMYSFAVKYVQNGELKESVSNFTVSGEYSQGSITKQVDFDDKTTIEKDKGSDTYSSLYTNLSLNGYGDNINVVYAEYVQDYEGNNKSLLLESITPIRGVGFTDWSGYWHNGALCEYDFKVTDYSGRTIELPAYTISGGGGNTGLSIKNGVLTDGTNNYYQFENNKWYRISTLTDTVNKTTTVSVNDVIVVDNKQNNHLNGLIRPLYIHFGSENKGSAVYVDNYKTAQIYLNPNFVDKDIVGKISLSDGIANVKIYKSPNSLLGDNVSFITAYYNGDRLLEIKIDKCPVIEGNNNVTTKVDAVDGAKTVKVFLWSDIDLFVTPLTSAVTQ